MRTELFINIYKNEELYLQRKVSLKDKALFMGSSPEADVPFPLEEMKPFQLLLVPPLPDHQEWRLFDEVSEKLISLNDSVQKHELFPWNFEFKVETGFTPEWNELKHDPNGDTVVLSFLKDQSVVRRQYLKLAAQTRLRWKGQEIAFSKSELKNRPQPLQFEVEQEVLQIALAQKHNLSFIASLGKSLRGGMVATAVLALIGVSIGIANKGSEMAVQQPEIAKVMVVKIPSSSPQKQKMAQASASASQAPQAGGPSSASGQRSVASLGKAFKRFSKGLQGVSLAPSNLAGGFAVGNLGSKLQGIGSNGGGGSGNGKLFNAAAVGSTMGRGLAGKDGIRLLDDEMESSGGLKKEIIAQYIKSYLGQIVQCFERELSISPDLTGKVVVNFTINNKGSVSSALIQKSQFENPRFHGCITQKVHHWTFPVPEGGMNVVVNYPFLFRAQ